MAANESTCEVPVFVHAMEFGRNIFLGVCNTPQIRCSFDIVHLLRVPNTLKTIPGLLEMFKGKIGVQYQDLATISARLKSTYIKTNHKTVETQEMYDSHAETNFLNSKFGVLMNPVDSVSVIKFESVSLFSALMFLLLGIFIPSLAGSE
jgi:Rab3 GTPase-activating protein catalytic subunit